MKQTIYVDVLISVNLFINYFLLLSVAKILNLKTIKKRLILSAFVGAMYSLIILLPPMNGIFSLVIKLFMSASIVVLAFKWVNRWLYLNLSPLFLVVATFLAYLAIRLMNKITGCQNHLNLDYDILVKFNEKTLTLKAKVDTGNTLREPFSGLPVIVAQYKFIENMVPQPIKEYFCALNKSDSDKDFLYNTQKFKNFRLIPYKTISGTGILPAFKPTYIKILSKNQNIKKEAYIAVCGEKIFNEEFQALINYELIE